MDHNSSSSSDPLDDSAAGIDDELLQQLISGFSPTNYAINQHDYHHHNINVVQPIATPPAFDHCSQQHTSNNIRRNVAGGGPSNKTSKDKAKAVDVERRRRQEMAALNRSLRSHLPTDYIRGRRSISDHVQQAANYIKDLEGGIKELSSKRDELLKTTSGSSSSTTSNCNDGTNSNLQEYVTVKSSGYEGFIEVIVSTSALYDDNEGNSQRLPLSKILQILNQQGLSVINCVSSRVANNMIHTIQARVDGGRHIDVNLLEHQLTYHFLS